MLCTNRLDHILINGDKLYKSLNQISLIGVYDLPRQINGFQYIAGLEMKKENLYDSEACWRDSFLRNIFAVSSETSWCLLFLSN